MKFLSFCISLLLLSSCGQKNTGNKITLNSREVASVNGEPILQSELEQLIAQEMFDELSRIYRMKNIALERLIDEKIIEQEARKHSLSKSEYLDNYIRINSSNKDRLLSDIGLSDTFVQKIQGSSLNSIDSESLDGRLMIDKGLERFLKAKLVDSLRRDKLVSKYIYPPISPNVNLNDLQIYYRGNMKSRVCVVVASDFECDKCIQFHNRYNSIYNKYKEKVKFGYMNFSSSATLAGLACDAAYKQNKYWEFNDSLYALAGQIDSISVYNLANNIGLDMNKFHIDITDLKSKEIIENNNEKLVECGLFATPTIIVDGRLIFDSGSELEISQLIDHELEK